MNFFKNMLVESDLDLAKLTPVARTAVQPLSDEQTMLEMQEVGRKWVTLGVSQLLESSDGGCPFKKAINDLFDLDEERSGTVIVDGEDEYRVRIGKDGVTVTSLSGSDERAKEIEGEINDRAKGSEEVNESVQLSRIGTLMDHLMEDFDANGQLDEDLLSVIAEASESKFLGTAAIDVEKGELIKCAIQIAESFTSRTGISLDYNVTVRSWMTEVGLTESQFQDFVIMISEQLQQKV